MKKITLFFMLMSVAFSSIAQDDNQNTKQISKVKSEVIKRLKMTDNSLDSLGNFISNEKFQKVMVSLYDDSKGREEAEKDCKAYLTKKGIRIPENYQIQFIDHNWRIKFTIEFMGVKVSVDFDSESSKKKQ